MKRLWDMQARLTALEDRYDAALDELAKRYRRAEQSERDRVKREAKTGDQITLDEGIVAERHPAILDLIKRRGVHASHRPNTGTG